MQEVLKDLIRQKRQVDKIQKFLGAAIKTYLPKELENSLPAGKEVRSLNTFGEEQGKNKFFVAVAPEYKGELKGYFINGYYRDNNIDNFVRYTTPVFSISAPEDLLVFDKREVSQTFAQWIPFREYFKEFKIENK